MPKTPPRRSSDWMPRQCRHRRRVRPPAASPLWGFGAARFVNVNPWFPRQGRCGFLSPCGAEHHPQCRSLLDRRLSRLDPALRLPARGLEDASNWYAIDGTTHRYPDGGTATVAKNTAAAPMKRLRSLEDGSMNASIHG